MRAHYERLAAIETEFLKKIKPLEDDIRGVVEPTLILQGVANEAQFGDPGRNSVLTVIASSLTDGTGYEIRADQLGVETRLYQVSIGDLARLPQQRLDVNQFRFRGVATVDAGLSKVLSVCANASGADSTISDESIYHFLPRTEIVPNNGDPSRKADVLNRMNHILSTFKL